MLASFRIVAGVVAYRLRKLEMANMAATVSIALALHLPIFDVIMRAGYAFLLNVLVYLNNDYIDVRIDLSSSDKDKGNAKFLHENLRAALHAQWALVAILAAWSLAYDPGLLVALVAGGGICWWYSAQLKHKPFLDITAMIIWGVTMPLCGSPVQSVLGWALALQLGLFSGVFESIQVMRDADDDAKLAVRTTGVVLGKARTLMLARVLMLASTVYALLLMHPVAAAVTAVALFIPFAADRIEVYWTRVKLVYGIAWLILCAWLFWNDQTMGLLHHFGHAARLGS